MRALVGLLVLLYGFALGNAQADEPLPAPRLVPPGTIIQPDEANLIVIPHRVSQYEVWKYLAVDRQGRFRPRVILESSGDAYFLYNGAPYPWTTSSPRRYMPYATD